MNREESDDYEEDSAQNHAQVSNSIVHVSVVRLSLQNHEFCPVIYLKWVSSAVAMVSPWPESAPLE